MKTFRGIMCESCPYYRKEVYYYKNIDYNTGEVKPSSYVSHYCKDIQYDTIPALEKQCTEKDFKPTRL